VTDGNSLPIGRQDIRIALLPLLASIAAFLVARASPYPDRTSLIYGLEGDTVSLFQAVVHPLLTYLSISTYVFVYPLFLVVAYLVLKWEGEGRHVRYAITYTVVVLVSMPIFFFWPVSVTGYYLETVDPLLYEREGIIGSSVTTIDTLRKALPSLHAAHAAIASLYAPSGLKLVSWTITALIVLSTLYLGIHWLTDLVVGVVLAYGCYVVTPTIHRALRAARQQLDRW
jgi:membrane-associated phospholipid phosphatase